jgi:hypothetical protein
MLMQVLPDTMRSLLDLYPTCVWDWELPFPFGNRAEKIAYDLIPVALQPRIHWLSGEGKRMTGMGILLIPASSRHSWANGYFKLFGDARLEQLRILTMCFQPQRW